MNLFANCVLALNAATGERVWHFQTTHHECGTMTSVPTSLINIWHAEAFDAVVQMSKMGLTFVFDRVNGKPVFPVEERPVPASDVPGDEMWPTQPFPLKPPPWSGWTSARMR